MSRCQRGSPWPSSATKRKLMKIIIKSILIKSCIQKYIGYWIPHKVWYAIKQEKKTTSTNQPTNQPTNINTQYFFIMQFYFWLHRFNAVEFANK